VGGEATLCELYGFSCVFNQAVEFQRRSPGKSAAYKFRERGIPVPLPPPFSADLRARIAAQ
jgi:hypothetical protein